MTTPKQQPPAPLADAELAALMADLDSAFGKKPRGHSKEPAHKSLNRQFHIANPQLGKAGGKAPERLQPEDSEAWKPVARVTHVVRQFCRTCGDSTEHIGGEFVRYRSVRQFGGEVLRRTEHCPNVWWFDEEIDDQIEEHVQEVARCPGCIRVEQQAVAITLAADKQLMQTELDLPVQIWKQQETFDDVIAEEVALSNRPEVKRQRSRQLALKQAELAPKLTDLPLDIDLGDSNAQT